MNKLAALAAVPALALTLAACGDQTKDVEKQVQKLVGARGYPNATVDCPSSVDVKKGNTFTCTIKGADIKSVTIRINDNDGKNLTIVKVQ